MKKSIVLVSGILVSTFTFAQELKSKKGFPILPETGDYCLGIDATPFLEYAGGLFSNAGAQAPTWNFLNSNQTIIGKKMISESTAIRGILRLGFSNIRTSAQISDAKELTPPVYPNLPKMVTDVQIFNKDFIGLGAGLEKRRNKGRIVGLYGADAFLWTESEKLTYKYGNALSATVDNPVVASAATSTSFSGNLTTDTYGNGARILADKSGRTIGIGIRAFAGVEYFIAPRISLGAEFGWGFGYAFTGSESKKMESVGGTTPSVGVQEIKYNRSSSLILDVDKNAFGSGNGTLKLNFYF